MLGALLAFFCANKLPLFGSRIAMPFAENLLGNGVAAFLKALDVDEMGNVAYR